MTSFRTLLAIACLSSAALIPGLAHADDAPPAVKAFLDNLQRQTSAKPTYEAIKTDGANATITNLTLTKDAKDNDPGFTTKTAEVAFTGIADQGASLWQVGKATFTNTSVQLTGKDASLSASIPAASAEGWYIRAAPATVSPKDEFLSASTFAKSMTSGPITITMGGQTVKIDSIDTSWSGDPATGAGKFAMKLSNLAIPESAIALADQGGLWKAMGYAGLNFDLATDGDLKANGDNLDYAFTLALTGHNMGTLSLDADVSNLPVAAYLAMTKSEASGKGIDFATLAPQIQNVTVNGVKLNYADNSLVNKLLPIAAAMQGMDPKVLVASIPPTVQLSLIQFQNEALTKQAVDAVTKFLANPKSLTVNVKPTPPIKVSDFSSFDPTKPGDAITKLGVTVTADE